jgi:hypothetical protein
MTVIIPVTAGEYLMETTSEFAASDFVLTNQRSSDIFFIFPLKVHALEL